MTEDEMVGWHHQLSRHEFWLTPGVGDGQGGGISPDIFIPQDTLNLTSYYREAVFNGHVREFVFLYADKETPSVWE